VTPPPPPLPLPLLLSGAVLLLLCSGALLLLARMHATRATAARTLAVLGPYRLAGATRPDPRGTRPDLRGAQREQLWLLDPRLPLASLFGIATKHRADYPLRWWIVLVGALAAAGAATWLIALLVDLPQWVPVPVLWVVFCRIVFGFFARRRRDQLFRQFPDVLAMIARALRVGQTVTQALRGVAQDAPQPSAVAFTRLANRLAIGVPLAEALPEMARDNGLTEYRFFCTALLLQSQTGGSMTEALDTLAEVIRGRVTLRRRAHAMSTEARTSAIVLGVLPVLTFAAMLVVAPDYIRVLVDDRTGRRVLGAAVGMLLVGAVVMNAMVRGLRP
jgi:tight adherence protein B